MQLLQASLAAAEAAEAAGAVQTAGAARAVRPAEGAGFGVVIGGQWHVSMEIDEEGGGVFLEIEALAILPQGHQGLGLTTLGPRLGQYYSRPRVEVLTHFYP